MGAKKSQMYDRLRSVIEKSAHVTDTVEQGDIAHPDNVPKDQEVADLGPAAVAKDAPAPETQKDTPPVTGVPDEGVNYTADVVLPPQHGSHPTDSKLRAQPKAASQENLEALQGILSTLSAQIAGNEEKQAMTTKGTSETNSDKLTGDEAAGYEATQKVAEQLLLQEDLLKQAAMESFLQDMVIRGVDDGHKYADFMDGVAGGEVAGLMEAAALPGGEEPIGEPGLEEEEPIGVEELKALILAIIQGKSPQTPEEEAIKQILEEAGVLGGAATGAEPGAEELGALAAGAEEPKIAAVDKRLKNMSVGEILAAAEKLNKEKY
jgi:hypothetical protein